MGAILQLHALTVFRTTQLPGFGEQFQESGDWRGDFLVSTLPVTGEAEGGCALVLASRSCGASGQL